MIILDGDKLRDFWDGIALGFQKSPLEAVISVVIIAVLLAAPIALFLVRQRKARVRRVRRTREVFESLLARKNLSARDREVLQLMSRHTPRGELDLPQLITKSASFSVAAKRVVEAGIPGSTGISQADIAALRIKLGLVQDGSRGILHSTAELRPGTPLQLSMPLGRKLVGKVIEVQPEALHVQISEAVKSGSEVELRVRRPTGLYSLKTVVTASRGNRLELRHSENIERVQKRRYFRKVLRLPVHLTTEDPSLGVFRTRLIDLSAGGARMRNPGIIVKRGDAVNLRIIRDDSEPVSLKSRVTRVSPDKSLLSVSFESLKGSTRDQLMKLVFS
jgi:hypothetical protein